MTQDGGRIFFDIPDSPSYVPTGDPIVSTCTTRDVPVPRAAFMCGSGYGPQSGVEYVAGT